MKSLFTFFLISIVSLCFISCNTNHIYDKYIKQLDSLKVVVEQSVVNFKTIDSAECYNIYSKQFTYSQYITANLKDTITRATANDLQQFYMVGKGFVNYLAMRANWLKEANTSVLQLTNLSHDLKNGSVENENIIDFINEEKKEAEKIIEELQRNTAFIRTQINAFNKSLPTAETICKLLNNDVLPSIVNPPIKTQIETD